MIALATGRAVAAPGSRGLGAAHLLLRSIGIGGDPSPLLWAMAYDPIIVGVAQGTGSANPTLVGDTSAE
eukprot:5558578-Alexandrium_andersonii.AAC.1